MLSLPQQLPWGSRDNIYIPLGVGEYTYAESLPKNTMQRLIID